LCEIIEIKNIRGNFFSFTLNSKKHGKISWEYEVLNWCKKQSLLWMFKKHWLQKEENVRYVINLLFLSAGIAIAIVGLS
jgi:hypothetical protein